jgi:hypothetical protein
MLYVYDTYLYKYGHECVLCVCVCVCMCVYNNIIYIYTDGKTAFLLAYDFHRPVTNDVRTNIGNRRGGQKR